MEEGKRREAPDCGRLSPRTLPFGKERMKNDLSQKESDKEQLFRDMEKDLSAFAGKASCLFRDYEDPDLTFRRMSQEKTVSASTIKLAFAIAIVKELEDCGRSLEERVELPEELILEDSEVFEYGASSPSFRELIFWMLVNSDNTASNAIVRFLGFEKLNAFFASIGLTETKTERMMLDFDAVREGKNNYTSLEDFARCMELLYSGSMLTQEHRDFLLETLSQNRDHLMLQRYLYEPVKVMHKSGELDDIRHDAGIFVYGDLRWFLGVFCSDVSPGMACSKEAERLTGRIARKVLDYYELCDCKAEKGLSL